MRRVSDGGLDLHGVDPERTCTLPIHRRRVYICRDVVKKSVSLGLEISSGMHRILAKFVPVQARRRNEAAQCCFDRAAIEWLRPAPKVTRDHLVHSAGFDESAQMQ